MAIKTIIIEPNKILRQKSLPVNNVGKEEQRLMDDMLETMYNAEGIGLNGPPGMPFADFNIKQNMGFMSSNYLYDIHDKGENSHYPWYAMKRAELTKNVIQFDVPGDSNLFAGDVVNLQIPTHLPNHKEPYDQYLTGKWLVTAIHHKINNWGYVMTLECMKDGFYGDPDIVIPARG